MESKLKALKVVELKDILTKAGTSAPAKANKTDLIARILATPAAIEVYNSQNSAVAPLPVPTASQNDDLLAPPEDVDWSTDDVPAAAPKSPPQSTKPKSTAASTAPAANLSSGATKSTTPTSASAPPVASTAAEDEELEKRKKRAARFGMPLVEPPKPKQHPVKQAGKNEAKAKASVAPSAELNARAARFGLSPVTKGATPVAGQKRASPMVELDAEEQERRRKRAERFGTQ